MSESFAFNIDEETALDHQRMRYDDLLWIGQRAESLIGRHVRGGRAEFKTPTNAIAAIAFVTEVTRVAHLGDMLGDHRFVAAEATGGEHDGAATDILDHTAGALDSQADNPIGFIGVQRGDGRFGDHLGARASTGVE